MNLVQYSDSEGSDVEAPSTAHPAPKPAVNSKPAFQKVVDRSKPNKIRVNLPSTAGDEETKGDEPPAKKARMGGGTFSGFNSFLPAPKRAGEAAAKKAAGSGLAKGVSLKTSGAAAFSRQTQEEEGPADDYGTNGASEEHPSKTATEPAEAEKPEEEVKLVGKPMMFKPLSVANSQKKKKKATSATTVSKPASPALGASQPAIKETNATPAPPKPKPKVSLFSISQEETVPAPSTSGGDYQPMLYSSNQTSTKVEGGNGEGEKTDDYQQYQSYSTPQPTSSQAAPSANSLTSIAADLNLTAAERRQLFGRQRGKNRDDMPAVNVVNFNTDAEYKANEELRAAGETVQHNPVRAIAPGKHSLKQLVSAASTQKDALEEHFAAGRRNKKEAGSKYGW
ncbi:mitotic checkpoint regulator, MAD2B-interacting-domain-containing protein [Phyllosticta citrichinensis]|uniref:Mitotic checkpoint regulator, MAD2B-interacting-domain-containing protein n=1 Tax=Phyllosticta citrichinensis TaxID=1130410 RepID=A0ABR1XZC7_9PEZI